MISTLPALTRAAIPAVTWAPILAACASTTALAVWTRVDQPDHPVAALRLGALLLAIGLAFAVEDPAADVTAPSPVPFRMRCLARFVGPIVATTFVWLTAVVAAPIGAEQRQVLAADHLTVALIAAAVAVTAVRLGSTRPGLVAGPTIFALVLASSRLAILPGDLDVPDDVSPVQPAIVRSALIATIAGLALAGSTRDPARR